MLKLMIMSISTLLHDFRLFFFKFNPSDFDTFFCLNGENAWRNFDNIIWMWVWIPNFLSDKNRRAVIIMYMYVNFYKSRNNSAKKSAYFNYTRWDGWFEPVELSVKDQQFLMKFYSILKLPLRKLEIQNV